MKRTFKALTLTLAALAMVAALGATAQAADSCPALIAQADEMWAQRGQPESAQRAAELYQAAMQADPQSYEAAWKAARALYWVGLNAPEDKKMDIFDKGVKAAEKAIELGQDKPDGYYWKGVNQGKYGSAKGVMESLSLVDPIKENMAKVIELDPGYDEGGAYSVLGRMYYKLPGLFGGDNDKSIELLQKSIKMGPKRYNRYVFLAETYISEGEDEKAKDLLNQVLNATPKPGMEADLARDKADAQRLLKEEF